MKLVYCMTTSVTHQLWISQYYRLTWKDILACAMFVVPIQQYSPGVEYQYVYSDSLIWHLLTPMWVPHNSHYKQCTPIILINLPIILYLWLSCYKIPLQWRKRNEIKIKTLSKIKLSKLKFIKLLFLVTHYIC